MSKASVAQEPSMDEILASIRRIIETGEDRGGSPAPGSMIRGGLRPAGTDDGHRRLDEQAFNAAGEPAIASFPPPFGLDHRHRPQFPPMEADGKQADGLGDSVVTEAVPPIVASDDADRQGAAAATSNASPNDSNGEGADDDLLTTELENELAATWDKPEPSQPDTSLGHTEGVTPSHSAPKTYVTDDPELLIEVRKPASQSIEAPLDGEHLAEPLQAREPVVATSAAKPPHPQEAQVVERSSFQAANTDRRPVQDRPQGDPFADLPLASQATGSLVAASFEELAGAIRSGELRSLDAMAQDMLRPMLQDWLDDNLPRMVERLVREEIERMARGGRR